MKRRLLIGGNGTAYGVGLLFEPIVPHPFVDVLVLQHSKLQHWEGLILSCCCLLSMACLKVVEWQWSYRWWWDMGGMAG